MSGVAYERGLPYHHSAIQSYIILQVPPLICNWGAAYPVSVPGTQTSVSNKGDMKKFPIIGIYQGYQTSGLLSCKWSTGIPLVPHKTKDTFLLIQRYKTVKNKSVLSEFVWFNNEKAIYKLTSA
jgi:hypothetical protein